MTPQEQVSAQGHARVLVVLKPEKRKREDGRLSLALDETISLQQEVARNLKSCFRAFHNSRPATFARELAVQAESPPEIVVDPMAKAVKASSAVQYYPHLGVMIGTVNGDGLTALADDDQVSEVMSPPELSLIAPMFDDEDAALAGPPDGESWALQRLKVPDLWAAGITGAGVLIGHIDTGADASHPALADAIDAFAQFDPLGRQIAGAAAADSGFHGTHTAGILVGQPFQGSIFGVAPGAKLASATVIEGGDVAARVVGGLDWCIGQGVKVVNISLGRRVLTPQFATIMTLLRQRGVFPVVAIGNEGALTSRTPGNLSESLSVGATDELDQIWINSSSEQLPGPPKRTVPTIIAPGAGIWSAFPNAKLRSLSGTSMATPHVAGLAALLMEHRPNAAVADIEKAIVTSCKRPTGISTLRGNKGIPDAVTAMAAL